MIPSFTTGRKKIFCYEPSINQQNVQRVVSNAFLVHDQNVSEIDWLFQLYRGSDSIIENRVRTGTNENINHRAFVSYYSLIADYKANLFMQNPVVYVNADGEERVSESLREYNKIHRGSHKYARDKKTAIHTAVCGIGWRFLEYNARGKIIKDSVLSPQSVFAIYGDDTDDESMAIVYMTQELDESKTVFPDITGELGVTDYSTKKRYTVYTDDFIYTWVDGDDTVGVSETMPWGCPIVEYKMNPFYIGAFERVTSLIHLLSVLRSDGVNGVVQSVAGLIFGKNIGLPMLEPDDDEETIEWKEKEIERFRTQLRDHRQLWVVEPKDSPVSSIEYIATELFNADIDVLYRGLIDDIVSITRIPRSVVDIGGSGNSGAAQTASGIPQALEDAQNAEPYWYESERQHCRIELAMAHRGGRLERLDDGDLEFAMQRSIMADPVIGAQTYSQYIAVGVKPSDAARLAQITADPEAWEKRILDWRDEEYAWRMSHPETIKDEGKEETQEDGRDEESQGDEGSQGSES